MRSSTRPRVIPLAHNCELMISIILAIFTLDRFTRLVLIGGVAQVRHRTQKSACADSNFPTISLQCTASETRNRDTTGSPVDVVYYSEKTLVRRVSLSPHDSNFDQRSALVVSLLSIHNRHILYMHNRHINVLIITRSYHVRS